MNDEITTSIRLIKSDWDEFEEIAKFKGVTKSALIRMCIKKEIVEHKKNLKKMNEV